jgi:hypothetical protein
MGVVRLVSSIMAFFALCVLLFAVILLGSHSVSSARQTEFQSRIEMPLEAESMSEITAEPEVGSIVDPFATFTVLPREVATKVGDTFTIQVSVTNVTDMYSWQVHLSFDNTVLQCTSVSLPHDYVFSYAYTVSDALMDYNSTEFSNPLLLKLENDKGRVLIGSCLLGADQPNFNGSGGLCQIEFKAISSGSSNLTLFVGNNVGTFYLDPRIKPIIPVVFNSEVVVHSED